MHFDRDKAVQWQQVFVNPEVAPAFLKQKFVKVVPDEYLEWIAPSDQVDSQVSAVLAKPSQRRALGLTEDSHSACLQVTRRCKRHSSLVSFSTLVHPANLYPLETTS